MRRFWLLISIVLLVGTGCAQADVTPSSFSLALDEDAGPNRIAISPGGSYIALGNKEGLYLYDRETASLLWTAEREVTAMGFSPDEGLLAANMLPGDTWVGNAKIWDAKTGDLLYEIPDCHHAVVFSIVISSSNKMICASGAGDLSGTLDLWDYTTAERLLYLYTEPENGPIWKSIISSNETTIATNNYRQPVVLIDAQSGEINLDLETNDETFPRESIYVMDIAFNPSGDLIAASYTNRSGSFGMVGIWNVETKEFISHTDDQTESIDTITWTHDGSAIAAGTQEGKVLIWDSSTLELLATFDDQHEPVDHLAFTFDDQWLVTVSKEGQVVTYSIDS